MKRLALYGTIIFGISLPFQWLYLGNHYVSGASTLIFLFILARYKGWIK